MRLGNTRIPRSSLGSALLAADTSGFAIADRQRQFMGLWSADPALVRLASSRLSRVIEEPEPEGGCP